MSFGNYFKEETKTTTKCNGNKHHLIIPAGYGGMFTGTVYHQDNIKIKNAEDYFINIAKTNNKQKDGFDYIDEIIDAIDMHCAKYIDPLLGPDNGLTYHYQSGFGGDDTDGVISFWLPVKVPDMPNLTFKIENILYTIKWNYYVPNDDDSENDSDDD